MRNRSTIIERPGSYLVYGFGMHSKAGSIRVLQQAGVVGCALIVASCAAAPKKNPAPAPVASSAPAPVPSNGLSDAETPKERDHADGRFECLRVPPPREVTNLKASVVGIALDGDMEVLELTLPLEGAMENPADVASAAFVVLDGALPGAASVAVHDSRLQSLAKPHTGTLLEYDGRSANLFVRRPRAKHGTPLSGALYFLPEFRLGTGSNRPAQILRFTADAGQNSAANRVVLERWARALLLDLDLHQDSATHWTAGSRATAWEAFAGQRLIEQYLPSAKPQRNGTPVLQYPDMGTRNVIDHTIDVLSGAHSLYGALRNAEALAASTKQRTVPMAKLEPPVVRAHPFAAMLAQLGGKVPEEPLAQAVPAEFFYLRSSDMTTLFNMFERIDDLGSPVMRLMGNGALSRDQVERYSTELGLARSQISKMFGPALVESVALVGSDAYFGEGTDLSLLFQVKSEAGFRNGLALTTALRTKEHGGADVQQRKHQDIEVTQTDSKDHAVHQFSAFLGSRAVISNSWVAIGKIIDTLQGRHAPLAKEADFRYMLARDASVPAPILMYMGDRFIAEAAGPKQRILESRRVRALAELLTPPLSAMLFGYLEGRSPSSTKELLKSGLLKPAELRHSDGHIIAFEPGFAPQSIYGTPSAPTPVIELEAPTSVSQEEADAYRRWAAQYSAAWSGTIDPVALRLGISEGQTQKLTADLRVLPLIVDSEYREFLSIVGGARVTAEPARDGLRLLMALDRDASWRRSLNRELRPANFIKDLSFDIIGDWAMAGVADQEVTTDALRRLVFGTHPNPCATASDTSVMVQLSQIPAYGGIAIANVGAAAIALTAIHREVTSTFGDQMAWDSIGKERGIAMTRVHLRTSEREASELQSPPIYFALLKDALYVATTEATLRLLITTHLDGKGPRAGRPNDTAPNQVTVDLAPRERGAFADYLLEWVGFMQTYSSHRWTNYVNALFRGVPELVTEPKRFNALALTYLGAVPTIDGDEITGYGPEGVILKHAGTPIRPQQSQATGRYQSLFKDLVRARAAIAFDTEKGTKADPPERSLHTRVELEWKR